MRGNLIKRLQVFLGIGNTLRFECLVQRLLAGNAFGIKLLLKSINLGL